VPGRLLVVATPLGHLDDLTPRALASLRGAAAVACEDTRRTAKLLVRYGVRVPTLSCHRFNERHRLESVLSRLHAGQDVALVSDSGTPGISDPGALLVRAALEAGLAVSPIPGPCAITALLSAAGLDSDRFVFEGFLPSRAGERRRRLRDLQLEERTLVLFESPRRVAAALRDIADIFGERTLVLGRELTKVHEEVRRGTALELAAALGPAPRGEVTLAIAGRDRGDAPRGRTDAAAERIRACWSAALDRARGDRRTALRAAARELGLGRAELQRRLAELGRLHD
jgi:16S rRNA (cytidine1402-2'-O)-methyltransferase